jgi:phosphoribosylaminoimidazole-succinocarboxamide synthase
VKSDLSVLLKGSVYKTELFGFPAPYRGKVRDVYSLNSNTLGIIVTDRISAFDHVFDETIPFKGQILNQLAAFSMDKVQDIIQTHIIDVPHPNVTIARKCTPLPVEVVVRGHLTGHAWRTYKSGERVLCGEKLPEGLKENESFPTPIITPTTKAMFGHDEDITHQQIIDRKLVSESLWIQVCDVALKLFQRGRQVAKDQGLILADTKYEFGIFEGDLVLIDEIHTADSSRYFYLDKFEERVKSGEHPQQLSKEFLREWLISQDFMGKDGQSVPTLPDELRLQVYKRYAELFEILTGSAFTPVFTFSQEKTFSDILKPYLQS